MILLDENVPEGQRLLLRSWGIRVRQIGWDVGRAGALDEAVLPLLRRQSGCTFFTRDIGFYDRDLGNVRYCLIALRVGQMEVATFVRRLLRHASFRTRAARMGIVARVSHSGIRFWRGRSSSEEWVDWRAD